MTPFPDFTDAPRAIDHDEVIDLAGAFALGALTSGDAAAVDAHLNGCRRCAIQVEPLVDVAFLLPMTCDDVAPSPDLETRVLAAIHAENEAMGPIPANVASLDEHRRRRRPSLRAVGAVAAAVVAVAVGTIALERGVGTTGGGTRTVDAEQAADLGNARVALVSSRDGLRLQADGLAAAPDGKSWVVWARHGQGGLENLGTVSPDAAHRASFAVPGDASEILITAESNPRTRAATSPPAVDLTNT